MKARVGKFIEVPNRNKKFNSNNTYFSGWIGYKNQIVPVLFTQDQIESAMYRAKNNPEDIVGRSITSIILD